MNTNVSLASFKFLSATCLVGANSNRRTFCGFRQQAEKLCKLKCEREYQQGQRQSLNCVLYKTGSMM